MTSETFQTIFFCIALLSVAAAGTGLILTVVHFMRFIVRTKKEAIAFYKTGQIQQLPDKILQVIKEFQESQIRAGYGNDEFRASSDGYNAYIEGIQALLNRLLEIYPDAIGHMIHLANQLPDVKEFGKFIHDRCDSTRVVHRPGIIIFIENDATIQKQESRD